MTRRSPLTRHLTGTQRADFHKRLQLSHGHYFPLPGKDGKLPSPRGAWSYRGARRNTARIKYRMEKKQRRQEKTTADIGMAA